MNATNSASFNIGNLINSLHPNQVSFLTTGIQIVATFITVIITAWVAIKTAFGQTKREFENKVIYEGWKDFQGRLFDFSKAFTDYSVKLQWLSYFLDSQDNSLVNKGNKTKYRQEKWQELSTEYTNLLGAYTRFLVAFETHEVLFIPLKKMKSIYAKEFRKKISDVNLNLLEKIFLEMYGSKNIYKTDELKKLINSHWEDINDVQVFLDDFRVELQNETIGKIMGKKLEHRKPNKGLKILTRNGFITK